MDDIFKIQEQTADIFYGNLQRLGLMFYCLNETGNLPEPRNFDSLMSISHRIQTTLEINLKRRDVTNFEQAIFEHKLESAGVRLWDSHGYSPAERIKDAIICFEQVVQAYRNQSDILAKLFQGYEKGINIDFDPNEPAYILGVAEGEWYPRGSEAEILKALKFVVAEGAEPLGL